MGLISDYLEDCRDNTFISYDPCMTMNEDINSKDYLNVIRSTKNDINKYQTSNTDTKSELHDMLVARYHELNYLKNFYICSEKTILEAQNTFELKTSIVKEKLIFYSNDYRRSYIAICDTMKDISKVIGNVDIDNSCVNQDELKSSILKLIVENIIFMLIDNYDLDTSIFRKLVHDVASIINYFEGKEDSKSDKIIVSRYLQHNLHLKFEMIKCANCNSNMFEELPYCFNCFERN